LIYVCAVVLAVGAVGCGNDDGTGNDQDAALDSDGTTSGDDAAVGEDASVGADAEPDAAPQPEPFLELQLSSTVVTEEDEGGWLSVQCLAFDPAVSDAPLAPDPGDPLTIEVTGITVDASGADYTFPDHGEAVVTCTKAGWSMSTTSSVTVIGEWIDPRYAQVAADMAELRAGIRGLLSSQNQADAEAMQAYSGLLAATDQLDTHPASQDAPLIRDFPGGLPSRATIEATYPPTADDTAFTDGVARLRQHLQDATARVLALDPAVLSQADVDALAADVQTTADELTSLEALAPGPGVVLDSLGEMAGLLLDDMPAAELALARYLADMVVAQEPGIVGSQKFGFISLVMGCFNTSNLQVTLINKIYGKYLNELDAAFNTLILGGLVDTIWPPVTGGPVIEFLVASASLSMAVPGYDSYFDGYNFNQTAARNLFIILASNLTNTAEALWNAVNVGPDDTIWDIHEKLQAFQEAVNGLGANIVYGQTYIEPGLLGSDQTVGIGPFPNLGGGSLPQPIHIIPINLDVGRGPSHQHTYLP
jgi:hypothetical protein